MVLCGLNCTKQQWKILILWVAFFTASLASLLLCISCLFRSNPFPEGPDGQSFWSGWIYMHTCALTHLLFTMFTNQAEWAVLSILLKCCLDGVVKMTRTVVCFTCSQHWALWKLFLETTSVLIKEKSGVLRSQLGVSLNVIYAARYKAYHLFTLRCYRECAFVWV